MRHLPLIQIIIRGSQSNEIARLDVDRDKGEDPNDVLIKWLNEFPLEEGDTIRVWEMTN